MDYWKNAADMGDNESIYNLGICYAKMAISSWESITDKEYSITAKKMIDGASSIGWDE